VKPNIVIKGNGSEVHFAADAFAHFVLEIEDGLVECVIGVRGPKAEKHVQRLVDFAHEIK